MDIIYILDTVPKASSPLLTSPPTMTPGISPPMTLPLSTVSPSNVLPTVSPLSLPAAPSPIGLANSTISPSVNQHGYQSSPVNVENLVNAPAIIGQTDTPLKPAPPAAPSRKSRLEIILFFILIMYLF